jgi:integrase
MARHPEPWWYENRGIFCVTINGKRHKLGPDKKRAHAQFHKLMSQPRRQIKVAGDSLYAIFDLFLEWSKQNRSAATYEWYCWRLQKFKDAHPGLSIEDLKPYHVEEWATKPGQSVTTKRNNMRAVKRALKWAVSRGHLDSSPIALMEIPTGTARDVLVSKEEMDRLLEHVTDPGFLDLLVFVMQTGCRPQEAWRLEARHIDLEKRRVVFPAAEAKGGKNPRVVYLPDRAFEIVEPLVQKFPNGSLFRNSRGRAWNKDSVGCKFDRINIRMGKEEMQRRGEEISAKQIADFTKELAKTKKCQGKLVEKTAAEMRCEAKQKLTQRRARQLAKRCCLYALRHAWATDAIERDVDPVTTSKLMGHKDTSMLNNVYVHIDQNPKYMLKQMQKAAGD